MTTQTNTEIITIAPTCEGFAIQPEGLIARDDLTRHQWDEMGWQLANLHNMSMWLIGDWLRAGEQKWGVRYQEAQRLTGLACQTLMNAARVCKQFEISRRREKLSFTHHADAAALEPGEREAALDEAETRRLSSKAFREYLKSRFRDDDDDGDDGEADGVIEAEPVVGEGPPRKRIIEALVSITNILKCLYPEEQVECMRSLLVTFPVPK